MELFQRHTGLNHVQNKTSAKYCLAARTILTDFEEDTRTVLRFSLMSWGIYEAFQSIRARFNHQHLSVLLDTSYNAIDLYIIPPFSTHPHHGHRNSHVPGIPNYLRSPRPNHAYQ